MKAMRRLLPRTARATYALVFWVYAMKLMHVDPHATTVTAILGAGGGLLLACLYWAWERRQPTGVGV